MFVRVWEGNRLGNEKARGINTENKKKIYFKGGNVGIKREV